MKFLKDQNPSQEKIKEYFEYLSKKDYGYDGKFYNLDQAQKKNPNKENNFEFYANNLSFSVRRSTRDQFVIFIKHKDLPEDQQAIFFIQTLRYHEVKNEYEFRPLEITKMMVENNKVYGSYWAHKVSQKDYQEIFIPLIKKIYENSKFSFKDKISSL